MRRVAIVAAALAFVAACRDTPRIKVKRRGHEVVSEQNVLATTDARMLWTRPADAPRLPNECEVGDVGECMTPIRVVRGSRRACPCTHCMLMRDGSWRWNRAECNTPLVVAFDERPVEFTRADAEFPVGVSARTEWVSPATPWLALDRDGSGCIESARELFAGFDALAELDANADGRIDAQDRAFAELVLWADANQDKRCTPEELTPLPSRVARVPLAADRREPKSGGSYEGETALLPGGGRVIDVYLDAL